jgi:hypothetical protein
MIKLRLLKKITMFTLSFFIWFSFTANFNFAQEVEESYLEKAKELYKEGDYTGAKNLLEKFVKRPEKKKEVAEAYYLIAKIYFDVEKDRQKASKYLKKAFYTYPKLDIEEINPEEKISREFLKIVNEIKIEIEEEKVIEIPKIPKKKKKFPWIIVAAGVAVVAGLLLFKPKPKPKKYNLTVERGEGVDGVPASGTYEYNEDTNVNYSYSLQSGYSDLNVTLDGNVVPSTGTIPMDRNHQLRAMAAEPGSINVTSTPTGADIFLDGVDTGQQTNAVIQNVTPGTHTIRLTLAGYDPAEQTVNVTAGQEIPVNLTLNRSYTNVITINGKLGTKASGQDENTGQDAYQFYVAENCNLTIQFDSEGHIRPEFALLPSANTAPGNVLVGGSGRGERITYTVTTSGKYYVVAIEDETPDTDEKAGTYTITITSDKQSLGDYQQVIDEGAETLEIVLTGRN